MRLTTLTTAAALTIAATAASAVPLDLRNIGFLWNNVDGGANIETTGDASGDHQIRWGGADDTFLEKSGYRVLAAGNPVPNPGVGVDESFILGSFTHFNEPIPAGTSINSVDLLVVADVYDNGDFVDQVGFLFGFEHLETSNAEPCDETPNPIGSECDDQVTVTLVDFVDTFESNGILYTLEIEGFLQGNVPLSQFWSGEGNTQTADVQARFTAAAVPLPAGAFLLLGGFGVMAASRRRRKAS